MKIDYTITFKDALFLASELLPQAQVIQYHEDWGVTINEAISSQLFNLAQEIYEESLRRSSS